MALYRLAGGYLLFKSRFLDRQLTMGILASVLGVYIISSHILLPES
jgi:hypothetical protein